MKKWGLLLFINLAILACIPAIGQDSSHLYKSADSTTTHTSGEKISNVEDNEFNIFLLLFGMAAVSFMAGFIFLGAIAALVLIFIIIVFMATGILSASIVTGWYQKSITKGIRTLFILGGMVAGIVIGILGFGSIALLFKLNIQKNTILLTGSISGFIIGALVGWIVFKIMQKGLEYAKKRFG